MIGDSISPRETASPCPLAPRTAAAVATSAATVVTHKEWVIPPRPKPGRKPATDTPPTKRKAQNRAAQRAFRERRAARVNELEDKLKEVEAQNSGRDQEYQDKIQQLTKDNVQLTRENSQYKAKLETLERECELLQRLQIEQRAQPSNLQTQIASPAPSLGHEAPCGQNCVCLDAMEKIPRDQKPGDRPIAAPVSVPLRRKSGRNKTRASAEIPQASDPMGCGDCSKDGGCACIEKVTSAIYSKTKRSTSPNKNAPKRTRTENCVDPTHNDLETDFTSTYMTKTLSSTAQMPDPCGFCSDGTPCVCAEVLMADSDSDHDAKLPPLWSSDAAQPALETHKNQQQKPMALHPPTATSAQSGTRSGLCPPGGCAQCKSDPMSTLFCQSVATRLGISESKEKPVGCCGGSRCRGGGVEGRESGGNGGSSCGGSKEISNTEGTYIPTSAVYQTLSRHRGFQAATQDLGSLVRPLTIRTMDGGCPQIEVSSVRDVLKQLDRRFGSDA